MRQLDEQEMKIIKELIKDPRLSDNQIGKITKVPIRTVSRKRKKLEEEELINYYVDVNHEKLSLFKIRQLYIIKFKEGLTINDFGKALIPIASNKSSFKYVTESSLAEMDGHLTLLIIVNAKSDEELSNFFNGILIKNFKKHFGEDSILDIKSIKIIKDGRLHHNYIPQINMNKGKIKKDWPEDFIFVS